MNNKFILTNSISIIIASLFGGPAYSLSLDDVNPVKIINNTVKEGEKAAQDLGKTTEKAAQDLGKTTEKAAQDLGKTTEKAAQDLGKTTEKAAQDTGITLEKAAHDTGNTIEKTGQDIGHFLQQATNFKLDCKLPDSKPDNLQSDYKPMCQSDFDKYKNDVDVCNKAGGTSLIAAAATASVATTAVTFGASYALAKIAFELCQNACHSQGYLNQCKVRVENAIQEGGQAVIKLKEQNDNKERETEILNCLHEGYSTERLLTMDNLYLNCKTDNKCNSKDEEYKKKFETLANAAFVDIDKKEKIDKDNVITGKKVELKYGEYIQNIDIIKSISLYQNRKSNTSTCKIINPKALIKINKKTTDPLKIKLILRRNNLVLNLNAPINFDSKTNTSVIPIDITNKGVGLWKLEVLNADGKVLASYGFIYRYSVK